MAREPVSLSSVLETLLKRNPQLQNQFNLMRLQQEWRQLPAPFPDGTAPLAFDGVTLVIAVRNIVWRQEMSFRSGDLEAAMRAAWPRVRWEKLQFKVAPLPEPPPPPAPPVDRALRTRTVGRTTPGSPGEQEFRRIQSDLQGNEEPFARSLLRMLQSRLPEDKP